MKETYNIIKNNPNFEIPAGWEIVPPGNKMLKSYKYSFCGSKDIKKWHKNSCINQIIKPNWGIVICKSCAAKYPTKINWCEKDYVAPAGWYFLKTGDEIKVGDGFVNHLGGITNYNNGGGNVMSYYIYPSIRKIPVKSKENIDNPPAPKYEYKKIKDFNVGDVFGRKGYHTCCLIINSIWDNKYSLSGRDGLNNYSNCQNVTKEEMINYLNKQEKIFILNINDKIKKTLEMAAKMVNNSK